ncbi:hypothetical protein BKA62DRAFT_699718 [Auriculariales sp. MPI-PUGE-AT-0066]|nr:hypothetical protein BKA62DRAFT_699718 [Auriculariales sp. MPI-PUGE-AT-0066]
MSTASSSISNVVQENEDWFCTKCGESQGTSQDAARRHWEACSTIRQWVCRICQSSFSDYWAAERHVYDHWRSGSQVANTVLRSLDLNKMR